MSLAMYAASINEQDPLLSSSASRQQQRNRTQRNKNERVNSVIQTLRNMPPINQYDESTNLLGDFKPMQPAESSGVEKTKSREQPEDHDESQQEESNQLPPIIPMYPKEGFEPYEPSPNSNSFTLSTDIVLKKLNYVITLLEEQQDVKTSHVAEEVVLYFFLGIFIIFIVDSFVKVGKYIR
jgi:hypothetical protein